MRSAVFAPALIEHLPVSAQRRARGVAQALEELRVRHAMTWDVVTTHPEATLEHAARVMFLRALRQPPGVGRHEAGGHPH